MLTEDQVVDAVCRELAGRGYEIVRKATAVQHGDDIIAAKDGERVVIEAKGAGSSKAHSARYGSEFSSAQVFDHVAKAVLKALRVTADGTGRAGIALPDNANHRREIERVSAALGMAGISVFWVDEQFGVLIDSPWDV